MIYQWTPRNSDHIARHGVREAEAIFVIDHARAPFPREIEAEKQLVWGQTAGGRYIQVIFIYLSDEEVDLQALAPLDRLGFMAGEDEVGYVLHARDLTTKEKRRYRRMTR